MLKPLNFTYAKPTQPHPDFHPSHAWINLHLHPDALSDDTAKAHLAHHSKHSRQAGRTHLWASVREDYRSSWPDLEALGFHEVHRTFGGGFHLKGWTADTSMQRARL